MSDKLAGLYKQVREIIDWHDDVGCPKKAKAVGVKMCWADMERIGIEEGEVVYPSKNIAVHAGEQQGKITAMCDACGGKVPSGDGAVEKPSENVDEPIVVDANKVREEQERRVLQPA